MTEQFQTPRQETDVTREVVQRPQDTLRELVASRVRDTPVADDLTANREAADFGLDGEKYDVFQDTESPFAGGFKKFVSKEDPSEVLEGLSWPHIGGATNNPNRYVYNMALRPNGDIVGRVSVDNAEGSSSRDVSIAAGSSDPEEAKEYQRMLEQMSERARTLTAENKADTQPNRKKGRVGRLLARLSFR